MQIKLIEYDIRNLTIRIERIVKYVKIYTSGIGGLAYRCNIRGTDTSPNLIYVGGGGSGGASTGNSIGVVDTNGGGSGGMGGFGNNDGSNGIINTGGGGGGGGKTSLVIRRGGNGGSGRIIIRIKNFKRLIDIFLQQYILNGGNGGSDNGLDGDRSELGGKGGGENINTNRVAGRSVDEIGGSRRNGDKYRGGYGFRNQAGGGGGYYGGGSSGNKYDIYNDISIIGGGGGGSSYINNNNFRLSLNREEGLINQRIAPNGSSISNWENELVYIEGKGKGGYNENGSDGLVVIEWFKYEEKGRENICGDTIKAYINKCEGLSYTKYPKRPINIESINDSDIIEKDNGGYRYELKAESNKLIIGIKYSSYIDDNKTSPLYLFDGDMTTEGKFGNEQRFTYNSSASSGSYIGGENSSKYPNLGIDKYGEWIEIETDDNIILGKYEFVALKDRLYTAPGMWYLYGINPNNESILLDKMETRMTGNRENHYFYDIDKENSNILKFTKYICNNGLEFNKYVFIITGLAKKYSREDDYEDRGGILSFAGLSIYAISKENTILSTNII